MAPQGLLRPIAGTVPLLVPQLAACHVECFISEHVKAVDSPGHGNWPMLQLARRRSQQFLSRVLALPPAMPKTTVIIHRKGVQLVGAPRRCARSSMKIVWVRHLLPRLPSFGSSEGGRNRNTTMSTRYRQLISFSPFCFFIWRVLDERYNSGTFQSRVAGWWGGWTTYSRSLRVSGVFACTGSSEHLSRTRFDGECPLLGVPR